MGFLLEILNLDTIYFCKYLLSIYYMQLASLKSAGDIKKNKTYFQTSWEKSFARGEIKQIPWSRKHPFCIETFVLKSHCQKMQLSQNNFGDTAVFSVWISGKDVLDIRTVASGGICLHSPVCIFPLVSSQHILILGRPRRIWSRSGTWSYQIPLPALSLQIRSGLFVTLWSLQESHRGSPYLAMPPLQHKV